MGQVQGVQTRAKDGHVEDQRDVHVETGGPTLAQRNDVKEERIHGQSRATGQEHDAVPPFHVVASRVDHPSPRQVLGAAFELGRGLDPGQRRTGGALPLKLGIVGRVAAAGRVEHRETRLSASVAFRGTKCNWVVSIAIIPPEKKKKQRKRIDTKFNTDYVGHLV